MFTEFKSVFAGKKSYDMNETYRGHIVLEKKKNVVERGYPRFTRVFDML